MARSGPIAGRWNTLHFGEVREFGRRLRENIRPMDVACRYGGEEFVVLLPDCSAEALQACCERLRLAFAGVQPAALGWVMAPLSLSVGMTLLTPGDNLDTALHRADQALYRAKRGGRDRCLPAWEVVDA